MTHDPPPLGGLSPTGAQSGARALLRRLRRLMAESGALQDKLNSVVRFVAASMVADVCSIYLARANGVMELFATHGLSQSAVHTTLMRPGEGFVGVVASTARPVNLTDAFQHPKFSYRPETGEDPYTTFLGVPMLRDGRLTGVLVVQNSAVRHYGEDDVDTLDVIAMVMAEAIAAEAATGQGIDPATEEFRLSRPDQLEGVSFAGGLAIGKAVFLDPVPATAQLLSDDPGEEETRLEGALAQLSREFDELLGRETGIAAPSREILETLRLLAADRRWKAQLTDAVRQGLTSEAAIARVRSEHRARMAKTRDPYLRERLHDLEELDNRLMRALTGVKAQDLAGESDCILIARNLGAGALLELNPNALRGVLVEEGSKTSHAAIVARALGIPMLGAIPGLASRIEPGDMILIDAEAGHAFVRPQPDRVASFRSLAQALTAQQADYARKKDLPAISLDGVEIELSINAGLEADLKALDATGAAGIGLFRTEFQFLVSDTLPSKAAQTALYAKALAAAGERPVVFRTLDVGGDKGLPYLGHGREENPALGWRAIRVSLDRPALLRYQVRALIEASAGKILRIMLPLVATASEAAAARALILREIEMAQRRDRPRPRQVRIGAMIETPAAAFVLPELAASIDFVSIGSNDLAQYFFAADRNNPLTSERYDLLSLPGIRFLQMILRNTADYNLPLSLCGEAAGKPLDAVILAALGFRRLSMAPAGVGPVRRALRSARLKALAAAIDAAMAQPDFDARALAHEFCIDAQEFTLPRRKSKQFP